MQPLKVWDVIGAVSSFLSFVYEALIVLRTLLNGVDLPGSASLIVAINPVQKLPKPLGFPSSTALFKACSTHENQLGSGLNRS